MINKSEMININNLSKSQKKRTYSVILKLIHKYVDKRARIKDDYIIYTLFNKYTRNVKNMTMKEKEIYTLFSEMYP